MIKGYRAEILKIYDQIRQEEEKALEQRREEIKLRLPQVIELESQIGRLCVQVSLTAFKNTEDREAILGGLKHKITDLRVQKSEVLAAHGYPIDYLSIRYRCHKCKDTGFIGISPCICYKQKLVDIYYNNSDLKEMIQINNFDNFDISLYSSKRLEDDQESPRRKIEKLVLRAKAFIDNFDISGENLLFYGNPGTGKTFLSNCIARELLNKSKLVVYRTSEDLIQNLKSIRFNNDQQIEELILNCDCLIIDDLGAEQITDFSTIELFNLLNKRLLKNKKMIISTNCSLEYIMKSYSDRISSRLMGNFTLCKFIGDDLRIKKNYARIRKENTI